MDLLAALPAQLPLVIPSTVLRETRHRSLPLFNRLQQLVQDEERCVWVWWNEECRETATAGIEEANEVVNDRNDRGELRSPYHSLHPVIRQTLHFYPKHIAESSSASPQLILLTDDRRNRELASAEGLTATTTREYVDGLQGEVRDHLVDLVAGGVDAADPSERKSRRIYDDYLPQEVLSNGVKSGRFLEGYFNASQYNYLEGTVRSPRLPRNILLVGRKAMNRSVDGDLVVVELLPESEWKAPGDEVLDQDIALKDDDVEGDEAGAVEAEKEKDEEMDVEEVKQKDPKEILPTGRVVGITKRNWRA